MMPDLLNKANGYLLLHINHSLDDILSFHKGISEYFYKSVFVSIPYMVSDYISDKSRREIENIFEVLNYRHKYYIYRDYKRVRETTSELDTQMDNLLQEAIGFLYDDILGGKKLLILEDGGYHYSVFCKFYDCFPLLNDSIVGCVEQTRNGIRAYYANTRKKPITYPVITVARSRIKMRIESYYVARSAVNLIFDSLCGLFEDISDMRFIVLGYGTIGRQVAEILEKSNIIAKIIDIDRPVFEGGIYEGRNIAFCINKQDYLKNTIIIGTTGNASFTAEMLDAFLESKCETLTLVSVSSKQTEFSYFLSSIKNYAYSARRIEVLDKHLGTEYCIHFKRRNKMIRLIGDGYPINFFCKWSEGLPISIVDMIFAEMLYSLNVIMSSIPLNNQLYIVGNNNLPFADIEESVLNEWISLDYDIKELTKSCWSNLHPCENYLMQIM